jgi:hypothetical protein
MSTKPKSLFTTESFLLSDTGTRVEVSATRAQVLASKRLVFLTGEEGGDESRGFAANMDGQLVQVPGFGLAAWENFIPVPNKGKLTAVMGMEDGSATDSQLWMYVGTKSKLVLGMTRQV